MQQSVLITGASSGIGLATIEKLLERQYKVIGVSRTPPPLTNALFTFIPFDLSKLHSIPTLCHHVIKTHPDLNILICNAGIGCFGHLEQLSHSQITQTLTINLMSHIFLVKGLLPELKKKDFSNLLFIGSEAALKGKRKGSIYCASKFALRGFAQALREECQTSTVKVSVLHPGVVNTPFYRDLFFSPGENEGNALRAQDVAEAILTILELPPYALFEEITLFPTKQAIAFKNKKKPKATLFNED